MTRCLSLIRLFDSQRLEKFCTSLGSAMDHCVEMLSKLVAVETPFTGVGCLMAATLRRRMALRAIHPINSLAPFLMLTLSEDVPSWLSSM